MPITPSTRRNNPSLSDLLNYGWVPDSHTWVYSSAVNITIAGGDFTNVFRVGTRLRFKQGGNYKYATVVSSSHASGTTTVVTAANNDYSFANSTITDAAWSHATNASGYPTWFAWTPTYGASGSMTFAADDTYLSHFKILGKQVTFQLSATGTTGGSASNSLTFTLPVTPRYVTSAYVAGGAMTADGSSALGGYWFYDTDKAYCRKYDVSSYGIGSGRKLFVNSQYEITG